MATPSEKIAPVAAPAPRRELTVRAAVISVVVAAIMGASFPYVVLKIGYGPNISVVAAFFGFMLLAVTGAISRRPATVYEANMAQTAGTAAGEIGFMCIVLAAIDMLNARSGLGFTLHLTALQIFLWLTTAGLLGAFLAVPLRRHYIDEENLTFADGTAAGETLVVLYQGPREAARRLKALFGGGGLSAVLALAHEPLRVLPEVVTFGAHGAALRMGAELGVLSIGAGLLVGLRVTLSMGLGMVLSWVVAPPILVGQGWVHEQTFAAVLKWVMWPATGLMVAGGITALALKWKVMARTFSNLSAKDVGSDEFPLRWMLWGAGLSAVALAVVQKVSLGFPVWLTAVSILLSIPLMLVGIRVLGETNWAPISTLANFMQAVFAGLAPGHVPINMIGSGMSGTVAGQGEHLMQCYRSGRIIGSNNRALMWTQLIGIPVGAAAVAVVYPALRDTYGFEGARALTSPISVKWAGFAELLSTGFSMLPHGSLTALGIALAAGVVLTVLEPRWHRFLPSTTAMGIGMLIPGTATLSMVLGGVAMWLWSKRSPETEAVYNMPLASGFIAGEALVVLVIAVIAAARSFAG
ncbi:MAG: OPT/YSL family transporter [Anaeromyxobacteraceae bacterium]